MRTILCALKVTTMEEAIHELASNGFLQDERRSRAPVNHQKQEERKPFIKPPFQKQPYQQGYPPKQHNQNWQTKMYYPQQNQQQRQPGQGYPPKQHNQNWQPKVYYLQQQRAERMEVDTYQTRRQNHYQQKPEKSNKPSIVCGRR